MSKRELLLTMLEETAQSFSGFQVNDKGHALQTATRAFRAGADDEVVVAALFHDAAKAVCAPRHGELIADMLQQHVRAEVEQVLRMHQDFTAAHLSNGRGSWRRWLHAWRPSYRLTVQFVDEWDAPSRDPSYPTEPLDFFLPLVDRVLTARYPLRRSVVQRIVRRLRRELKERIKSK